MSKTWRFFTALFALSFVFLASHFLLIGTGFWQGFDGLATLSLTLVIVLLSANKFSFAILLFVLFLHSLYIPVGLNFGAPSYQYIASLFATDVVESKEFLRQIPVSSYLIAFSIIPLLLIYQKLNQHFQLKLHQQPILLILSAVAFAAFSPLNRFVTETYQSTMEVKSEFDKLKTLQQAHQWQQSELENSQYDDYILVIGESSRRDYHHAYGYPIENTPFLSQTNGVLIDGFRSASTNTVASLRLMLTLADKQRKQPCYELNLVDLIKSAGIKTYWLSNQGYLGEYDTPIAALASKSDEIFFLKKGGSFNSDNYSDFELLPKFTQILQQDTHGKRFIVLHLYGSHPLACDRLTDYATIFPQQDIEPKYQYLNCYISSIKKTDEVLSHVYAQLQQNSQKTDRTFSMIYFSDHGMCHQDRGNEIFFGQSCVSKLHNDVPLFKTSSDDNQRKTYKAMKSGLNFLEGIANWIGIKNPQLDPTIDLFSPQPDSTDYGLENELKARQTPLDPAVDIRAK